MPRSSLPRPLKSALALAVSTALVWPGLSPAATPERAAGKLLSDQARNWAQQCNANEMARERIGQMTDEAAQIGLDILTGAGDDKALSNLSLAEGCLSLAGSAYAERPVIVLKKGLRHDVGVPDGTIRVNPVLAQQASLAYKLDELQINVLPQGLLNGKTYQRMAKVDPEAAKGHLHFSVAVDLDRAPRSATYNWNTTGTCLIGLAEGNVMTEFEKRASPTVAQGLSADDRRWLSTYGKALEFWHEAAHCLPDSVMRAQAERPNGGSMIAQLDGAGGSCSAASQNLSLIDKLSAVQDAQQETDVKKILSDAAAQNSPAVKIMDAQNLQAEGEDTFDTASGVAARLASESKATRLLPEPTPASREAASITFDNAQIVRFSKEALMDTLSIKVVEQRFPESAEGCSLSTQPTHPWAKLRLLWSISDPNTQYLTWLTPWLIDHPPKVQRQVFADAWAGVIATKKAISDKAFYRDWLRQTAAERQRNSLFSSPNVEPNVARADRWSQWLTTFTNQPSAIEKVITKAK